MKKSGGRRGNVNGASGLRWPVVLAVVIFVSWLVGSAAILLVSKMGTNVAPQATIQTRPPAKESAAPFSSTVDENGKRLRKFEFSPTIPIGRISALTYKPLAVVRGKSVSSALDVVRFNTSNAQGKVTFADDQRLSFMPGEMLAVNNTSLPRFRPAEIYDITMKRVQNIDVDVYLDACSQIKGVTRLDISDCADLTKEGAVFIDDYPSLRELHIFTRKSAIDPVAHLAALKKVSSIGLYSGEDLYPILLALRASINLRALKVQTPVMSEQDLNLIAAMPMLEELSLSSPLLEKPEAVANALKILCRPYHLKILCLQGGNEGRTVPLKKGAEALVHDCRGLDILQLGKTITTVTHN